MIRFATLDDAQTVADIHVDTWRAAYDGIVPSALLASLSKTKRAESWRRAIEADPKNVLVLEVEGSVSGWISFGKGRDGGSDEEGEIYAIYVRPERWRSGAGGILMANAEKELWARECSSIVVWVLERNIQARTFYEKTGYVLDGMKKDAGIQGASLLELRYAKKRQTSR